MVKFLVFITLLMAGNVAAEDIIQSPKSFLSSVYSNDVPKPKTLWLNKEQKQQIAEILQHNYPRLRVRYWPKGNSSVWILDEIGKEKAITVGLYIDQQQLKQVKVLVYRESRGDEVKHSFFTDQFINATLTKEHTLDRKIDGITGATLSVRALTKLSRVALLLDQHRLAKLSLTAAQLD